MLRRLLFLGCVVAFCGALAAPLTGYAAPQSDKSKKETKKELEKLPYYQKDETTGEKQKDPSDKSVKQSGHKKQKMPTGDNRGSAAR